MSADWTERPSPLQPISTLPWTYDDDKVYDANDIRIADTEYYGDAKFIALSANAHQALVDALRLAKDQMETWRSYYESEFRVSSDPPDLEYEAAKKQINDALQLVGVSEPKP